MCFFSCGRAGDRTERGGAVGDFRRGQAGGSATKALNAAVLSYKPLLSLCATAVQDASAALHATAVLANTPTSRCSPNVGSQTQLGPAPPVPCAPHWAPPLLQGSRCPPPLQVLQARVQPQQQVLQVPVQARCCFRGGPHPCAPPAAAPSAAAALMQVRILRPESYW